MIVAASYCDHVAQSARNYRLSILHPQPRVSRARPPRHCGPVAFHRQVVIHARGYRHHVA